MWLGNYGDSGSGVAKNRRRAGGATMPHDMRTTADSGSAVVADRLRPVQTIDVDDRSKSLRIAAPVRVGVLGGP